MARSEGCEEGGGDVNKLSGCHTVLSTRLDALERAIRERDWEQVEFQFDRVSRADSKLAHEILAADARIAHADAVQAAADYVASIP